MVRRFDLTQLGPISLQEHGDGSGVLSFGALVSAGIRMAGRNLNGGLPYLEVPEDVRGVYRKIRDAIEDAESAGQSP
jgi:alkanesulfonate monooxygenase SsuD/methylene tetrahydromethanopterin reductase-like flavin-dependent oxidoreductase (luciferase family)